MKPIGARASGALPLPRQQTRLPLCSRQVSERALAAPEPRAALRAVMRAWLPLSEAVLGMAVERLPDPKQAAPERLPRLLALQALGGGARLAPALQQVSSRVSPAPFLCCSVRICAQAQR